MKRKILSFFIILTPVFLLLAVEKDGKYYNNKCMEATESEDYSSKSLKYCDNAVKLVPKYFGVYYNRGIMKSHLKDFSGALADFDQAFKLNPQHYESLFWLGMMESELGDTHNGCDHILIAKNFLKADVYENIYNERCANGKETKSEER